MKFSEDRKQTIKNYILEKIVQKSTSISKTVAETFNVNATTVHAYINELVADNIIKKVKRGEYELVSHDYIYMLSRKNGDLDTDTYAFDACFHDHIKGFETNVQNIWAYTFSEMINNVMDHSMAENVKIIVIQNYLTTSVMIIDNGIGIFKKIQEHFHLPSIDEAICELFKGKLTTDKENHSGEGIFFSSKLMDEFFIASSGKIFSNNKYDDSKISDFVLGNQKGTCVFMALSNYSHKTAKEVFDAYANMDGRFVKTIIPLKNIFDSAPVSRSQAKRVCNRLDKFKEVIVDFEDIPWIGQGFAHQLFVVFANNNPDIIITPINMNEDITKMYNHVRMSS
ncbi:MAG: STAS-like domain-containing protein [Lachnospira sp.]